MAFLVVTGYGRAQTQNHANATWPAPGESAIEGGRRTSLRSRRDFERKQLANVGADVRFLRLFLKWQQSGRQRNLVESKTKFGFLWYVRFMCGRAATVQLGGLLFPGSQQNAFMCINIETTVVR